MNTKDKGDLAETKVITRLIELGYSVSIPFGDNDPYDLIWDDGKRLNRVQVKHGSVYNGGVRFNTCSCPTMRGGDRGIRGYVGEADYFAIYSTDTNQCYLIEIDENTPKTKMKLRIDEPENKVSTIRYAEDYTL